MLTTSVGLAEKYDYLSEKFKTAFAFLKSENLAALEPGTYPIDGDEVLAHVQWYTTMPAKASYVLLRPGDVVIVPPDDAHKPRCAASLPAPVKKIVVKVKV